MKYAIVKDSLVTNIVEWDGESEYNADGELIPADEKTRIGGEYNGVFVLPEPEPEPEPTAEQLQLEADKQSAQSKLAALGLTEAEIKAITR
jgi:hypothetical protein